MLSRRGFLQTLAAAVGTAVFEPAGSLWVPAPKPVIQVTLDHFVGTNDIELVEKATDQFLELDELAMLCATRLGDRFTRTTHNSLILREVVYEHTGHVHLEKMLLRVPEIGTVRFAPSAERCVGFADARHDHGLLADDLIRQLNIHDANIFAPIGRDLREGDAFSNDTLIALATDPMSGLSVRVIQFEHDGPRKRTRYGLEVAGGTRKAQKYPRHHGASLIGGM